MAETYGTATIAEARLIPWWLILLEGLAALIIGIFLLARPAATVFVLVQVLGWYWLITGILTLIFLFIDRTDMIWKLISGILGIIAGLIIIGQPILFAAVLPATIILVVGILGICFGLLSIWWAFKAGWGAAIMGILSIIFGLMLIASPYTGVVLMVYLLAFLGIIGGIATMYMAFKLR